MARLLPVVIFATSSLLVLKLGALALAPQGTVTGVPAARAETPAETKPAAEALPDDLLLTGSMPEPKPKPAAEAPKGPQMPPAPADNRPVVSPAERIVLEKLQERRQELEKQAREQELRESLLKATEKKIEERLAELKALEAKMVETPAKREEQERERLKNLVTMYESMRAKDAARIFDRLEMRVMVDLVNAMKPAKVADILAAMSPEVAEKLTLELAQRRTTDPKAPPSMADLPKIEGRPRP